MPENHVPSNGPVTSERLSPGVAEELRSLQLNDAERRRTSRPRRPLRFGRWFMLTALVAAVPATGYWWWPTWEQGEEVEAVLFSTEAKTETLLDKTGYIVPRSRVTLSPEVGGVIARIHFDEGTKVKKGTVLMELDDARYKADLDQAKAALASAEAQRDELKAGSRPEEIDQARAALAQTQAHIAFLREEVKRGYKSGVGSAISVSDHERNVGSLREAEATERSQQASLRLAELGPRAEKIQAAEAEVVRARANLDKARFYWDRTRIIAPCNATILEKKVELGEAVHPEVVVGTLCVLADLTDLEAEADVQERDLALLKDADECQVIPDAYPDRSYKAKFERLQPLVSKQRGVVKIKVSILNPDDALLPDMNCRIVFPRCQKSSSAPEVPLLPEEARVREGNGWVVYVLDGRVAQRRILDCGRTIGNQVEVRGGLRGGEVVLLAGSHPLREGQIVRPRFNPSRAPKGRGQ
jgi:RND family efflux transporter MFP subunit